MKSVHVLYNGQVQGVGFRYTAHNIATQFNASASSPAERIGGWVRNLSNGSVELVAQSSESLLKQFLDRIDEVMGANIRHADVKWGEASTEFADFTIRSTSP